MLKRLKIAPLLFLLISSWACESGLVGTIDDIFAETSKEAESGPPILIRHRKNLTTSESGEGAIFKVFLTQTPTEPVTIGLTSSNPAEGLPEVDSLEMTADNWEEGVAVRVIGVDDDVVDGVKQYHITTAVATSEDPVFQGFDSRDIPVRNHDDDSASIIFSPTKNLVTTEDGGQAKFGVTLNCEPQAEVVITLATSDAGEGTISPNVIRFDQENWQQVQAVTITGRNDYLADGPVDYEIRVVAVQTQDPSFQDIARPKVLVTNLDNEATWPGVTIRPVGPALTNDGRIVTSEAGTHAQFSVRLDTKPTAPVRINISSSNTDEGIVTPAHLIFKANNWYQTKIVTVTGQADHTRDPHRNYNIIFAATVSDDHKYNGISLSNIPFVNINKDKFLFKTAATVDGALGADAASAISNADAICNSDPARPASDPLYKAVIANSSRIASMTPNTGNGQMDWALGANTNYHRADGGGIIFKTSAQRIFVFGFADSSIDYYDTSYWTGMNSNWTNGAGCAGFTNTAPNGRVGLSDRTGTDLISGGNESCSVARALLCAEQ